MAASIGYIGSEKGLMEVVKNEPNDGSMGIRLTEIIIATLRNLISFRKITKNLELMYM